MNVEIDIKQVELEEKQIGIKQFWCQQKKEKKKAKKETMRETQ